MKTPTLDYIMKVSDLTSDFGVKLKALCKEYDRDIEKEMLKACIILSDPETILMLKLLK